MTEEEIKKDKEIIDKMTQREMASLWRFAPSGHSYFDSTLPLFDYFNARFKKLGDFTPEISKSIGW